MRPRAKETPYIQFTSAECEKAVPREGDGTDLSAREGQNGPDPSVLVTYLDSDLRSDVEIAGIVEENLSGIRIEIIEFLTIDRFPFPVENIIHNPVAPLDAAGEVAAARV